MAMLDNPLHDIRPVPAAGGPVPFETVDHETRMAEARERRAQVLAERLAAADDIDPPEDRSLWPVAAALVLGLLVGVGTVMVARTLNYREIPPPARIGMVPAPKPAAPATPPAAPAALPPAQAPSPAAPVPPSAAQPAAAGSPVPPSAAPAGSPALPAASAPVTPAPVTPAPVPPAAAGGDSLRPMPRPPGRGAAVRATPAPAPAPAAAPAPPVVQQAAPSGSLGRALAGINALTIGKAAEAMGVGGRVGPITLDQKGVRVRPPQN